MKSLIMFIVCGGILGAAAWGDGGAAGGAIGGFCFWVLLKIIGYLNRNADRIADQFDDD